MSVREALFHETGHIKIANFSISLLAEENVRRFYVTMNDIFLVQASNPIYYVFTDRPDLVFVKIRPFLTFLFYSTRQVPIRCQFHHSAEHLRVLIIESGFVVDDIRMVDRSQYANLIQCILFIFLFEVHVFHFLHCILMAVFESPDFLYSAEASFA